MAPRGPSERTQLEEDLIRRCCTVCIWDSIPASWSCHLLETLGEAMTTSVGDGLFLRTMGCSTTKVPLNGLSGDYEDDSWKSGIEAVREKSARSVVK